LNPSWDFEKFKTEIEENGWYNKKNVQTIIWRVLHFK
jgi:hypothetical protein